ncbi:MAG: hypothetical protein ACTSVY_16040 [Candidatus Helarchaeota archaeon]
MKKDELAPITEEFLIILEEDGGITLKELKDKFVQKYRSGLIDIETRFPKDYEPSVVNEGQYIKKYILKNY